MPPKRKTAEDGAEDEVVDWKLYTVAELKDELKSRGLPTKGKRADLVMRLETGSESVAAPDVAEVSAPAPTQKAKAKSKKKAPSDDIVFDGPLADEVVVHKHWNPNTGERRLRDFVPAPDDKFKQTSWRIRNERMFMLDRHMGLDKRGLKCQNFDIAGATGNIYHVSIGRSPTCTCMDAVSCGVSLSDASSLSNSGCVTKNASTSIVSWQLLARPGSLLTLEQMHSSSFSRLQPIFRTN